PATAGAWSVGSGPGPTLTSERARPRPRSTPAPTSTGGWAPPRGFARRRNEPNPAKMAAGSRPGKVRNEPNPARMAAGTALRGLGRPFDLVDGGPEGIQSGPSGRTLRSVGSGPGAEELEAEEDGPQP